MIWISTSSGIWINLIDPQPETISISDIAHALGNLCRFTGHTTRFYSVAEHSVHVANLCCPEHRLAGLMHDAAEAYVGDVARPLKRHFPEFRQIEHRILDVILGALGIEWPRCDCIKLADERVLSAEFHLMRPDRAHFMSDLEVEPINNFRMNFWHPADAGAIFLDEYRELRAIVDAKRSDSVQAISS